MAGSNGNGRLTVRQKMRAVLGDMLPHLPGDLFACLVDDLGPTRNIAFHLTCLRKELRPLGEDIATIQVDGKTFYQWVRLVGSPYRG